MKQWQRVSQMLDEEKMAMHSSVLWEKVLERCFENTLLAIAVMDRDFNFIRVNKKYAELDNRDVSEFPGKNHFYFYPSNAKYIFKQVVMTKQPYQVFARPFTFARNPERGVTYWDWTLEPITGALGDVELLLLTLNNVTARALMQKELEKSEERFRKVFESSPVMMSVINLHDGCYILVNQAWLNVMGYMQQEIVGKTYKELNVAACEKTVSVWETLVTEHKGVNNAEMKIRIKSGEIRDALLFAEFIELDGEPCLFNIMLDVTEHAALKHELNRLDRLNLVGQLAGGIGHEIRNPMTTVRGFLQIMSQKKAYKEDTSYFDIMISELDRANSIITEFLSLSRKEEPLNIIDKLSRIVYRLSPLIEAQALNMDREVVFVLEDVPDMPLGEKEICQLILNLVQNALEASPVKGVVRVHTYFEDKHAVLAVKDQGKGIDPAVMQHLWTPFYTTKENGTGLGLAICDSVVKRHKGRIDVETGSGGTTFLVILPLAAPENPQGFRPKSSGAA